MQQGSSSCADNALLTSIKAKSLGFHASILVQNNHAVVIIEYNENQNIDEMYDDINNYQFSSEDEGVWEPYKEIFVGSKSYSSVMEMLKAFV